MKSSTLVSHVSLHLHTCTPPENAWPWKCAASSLQGSLADWFKQQCSILQSPVFLRKIWQSSGFSFLHLCKALFITSYVLMRNRLVTDQQKYLNGLWVQIMFPKTLSSPFPLKSIKNQLNFFHNNRWPKIVTIQKNRVTSSWKILQYPYFLCRDKEEFNNLICHLSP